MTFYRIISILAFPFLELWLFYRVAKKKEDKTRLQERFGHSDRDRPDSDIIWIHAVSVGETNSAMILVDELLAKYPDSAVLFTTTTLTSASIVAKKETKYNGRLIHQFLPIDSYFCVVNFFNFWQPKMAIFVESEIWPNLICEAKKRGIPRFLVNARMSEKSVKKWKIARAFFFKIFGKFTAIFAQTKLDQERLSDLAQKEAFFFGNLKSQAVNLEVDVKKLAEIKKQIGDREVFLAASTHQGEEEIILETHKALRQENPDLLTIIVIRHPNRADEVTKILDVNFAQRSKGQNVKKTDEIYLVDSLGELGIFYSLVDFAFIGGSLKEIGGHNPFEAIKLDAAVISGENIFNFREIYADLKSEKACVMVKDKNELIAAASKLILDKKYCQNIKQSAAKVIVKSENISQQIIDQISLND